MLHGLYCTIALGFCLARPLLAAEPAPEISFAAPEYRANEASPSLTLQVVRTGSITSTVSVDYTLEPITTTPGEDYTPQSGTLTFAENQTSHPITIPILNNTLFESPETFRITLSNPSPDTILNPHLTTIVTIEDNDHAAGVDDSFDFTPDDYFFPAEEYEITTLLPLEDSSVLYAGKSSIYAPTTGILKHDGSSIVGFDFFDHNDAVRDFDGGFYLTGASSVGVISHFSGKVSFGSMDISRRAELSGEGNAIEFTTNRQLLVAGTLFQGTDTNLFGLARLFRTGARDESFSTNEFSGREVTALALAGDLFYAAATSTNEAAEVQHTLARYLPDGAPDITFPAVQFNGRVEVLQTLPNGQLLAAGHFTTVAGQPQSHLVRLTASGEVDPHSQPPSPDGPVYALALEPTGSLLVGGNFNAIAGTPRANLARLTPSGALDSAFDPGSGPDAPIQAIALQPDGAILIGGAFTGFSGRPSLGIVRLNGQAINGTAHLYWEGDSSTLQEQAGSGAIHLARSGRTNEPLTVSIEITGGPATSGADYGAIPSELTFAPGETRLEISIPLTQDALPEPRETIQLELSSPAEELLLTRALTEIRIQDAESPASRDVSFDFPPQRFVTAIAVQDDGKILVGGERLLRLHPDGTPDPTFQADVFTNLTGNIYTLLSIGDDLYVGGNFSYDLDGLYLNGLLRLTADGVLDTTFSTLLVGGGFGSATVTALTLLPDGFILLGGSGLLDNLQRLRPDGWNDSFYRPPFDLQRKSITALIPHPEGGYLAAGYNLPLARLDAQASTSTNFSPHLSGSAYSIQIYQDQFLVAGDMQDTTTGETLNLVRLHLDGTLDTNFHVSVNAPVQQSLPLASGQILISGNFTHVNGTPRNRIARLQPDGSLDTTFDPGLGLDYLATELLEANDGKVLVGGPNQAYYDGQPVPSLIRLLDLPQTGEIKFAASTLAVSEDQGEVLLSIERTGGSTGTIRAQFTTLAGTALPGTHYTETNLTVEFADGEFTSRQIAIPLFANPEYTGDKSFTVRLLDDASVVLDEATITILDAQPFPYPGEIKFATRSLTVSEEAGEAVCRIERIGGHSGPLEARLITISQSAQAGIHFLETNLVLQFADGDIEPREIAIPLLPDPNLTGDKTFSLRLSDPTTGVVLDQATILIFDAQVGTADPSYTPATALSLANIFTVHFFGDGAALIGGSFGQIGGHNIRHLARLTPDGQVDPDYFLPVFPTSGLSALAVQPDGKILLAGGFSSWGGRTDVRRLVRLNPDLSLDVDFSTTTNAVNRTFNWVTKLAVLSNGDILASNSRSLARLDSSGKDVGGVLSFSFSETIFNLEKLPNGEALLALGSGLKKLPAAGGLDPDFAVNVWNGQSGASPSVRTATHLPNGQILIGGAFRQVNGTDHMNVARLFPDGQVDPSFNAGEITPYPNLYPDNGVLDLELLPGGDILIAGHFETVQGIPRRHLARLAPDGTLRQHWDAQVQGLQVNQIKLLDSGDLAVFGNITNVSGVPVSMFARIKLAPNLPPVIDITAPAPSSNQPATEPLPIQIAAYDPDGFLGPVKLLVDGQLHTEFEAPPYLTNLTLTAGTHTLQAEAIDTAGLTTLSPEIQVTITEESTPIPLSLTPATPGQWQITLPTQPGATYTLQTSPDLLEWFDFTAATATGTTLEFPITTTNEPHLFYRVLVQPTLP